MIHDKISLAIQDVNKFKEKLKGVKKDIKTQEKIDDEQYLDLKKAYKDLRGQIKAFEEEWNSSLSEDDFYNELRELRVNAEEKLAHATEKLFKLIAQLPPKPVDINVETENGPVRVQIQPEMRLYVNGREEKSRV